MVGRLIIERHAPREFEVIVFTFLLILFDNFVIIITPPQTLFAGLTRGGGGKLDRFFLKNSFGEKVG